MFKHAEKEKLNPALKIKLNHAWPCALEPDYHCTEEYVRALTVELNMQA